MRRQMQRLGLSYDWQTEITTCLPDYYRWNQWFFLRMLERGLAYRKKSKVNWCPHCATVLANEQVIDGCCWRHEDTMVEQRDLEQWFLRTTNYAQELLDGLDKLPDWPEKVRTMQRNWIGRSEGATSRVCARSSRSASGNRATIVAKFLCRRRRTSVAGAAIGSRDADQKIAVFTTRLDTIFGATSLQLAPQHPLVKQFAQADERLADEVAALVEEQKKAREAGDPAAIEKHGSLHRPLRHQPLQRRARAHLGGQLHPAGVRNRRGHVGAGARRARLRVCQEIRPRSAHRRFAAPHLRARRRRPTRDEPVLPYTEEDSLLINSGEYNALGCQEAQQKLAAFAQEHGFGKPTVTFRLKDWGVSRQRYWGAPIPVLYCPKDGIVPVPDDQLPVLLPEQIEITQQDGSPLEPGSRAS